MYEKTKAETKNMRSWFFIEILLLEEILNEIYDTILRLLAKFVYSHRLDMLIRCAEKLPLIYGRKIDDRR